MGGTVRAKLSAADMNAADFHPDSPAAAPARVPVIVGPTASGKTALACALADRYPHVEIISADSRQIYIGMDIGTAKPSPELLKKIPHHLVDILPPDRAYSAGRFARDAEGIIDAVLARGGTPLVVGGTGFYIRALFHGLGAPAVDPEVYAGLERRMAAEGYDALLEELRRVDPVGATMHPPENRVKTLRALACWHQTGLPYSRFRSSDDSDGLEPPRYRPAIFRLMPDRALLYERINERVQEMVEQGLVEETRRLLEGGYGPDSPGMRTVGYVEAVRFIEGKTDREEMIADIAQATRRYAKRQMTWFRNQIREEDLIGEEEMGRWLDSRIVES